MQVSRCTLLGLAANRRSLTSLISGWWGWSAGVLVPAIYAWLLIAAAWADHSGGIWGAARHALTVGFITTMVFATRQRVLPAFGGARVLLQPSPDARIARDIDGRLRAAGRLGDPSVRGILSSGLACAAMFRCN